MADWLAIQRVMKLSKRQREIIQCLIEEQTAAQAAKTIGGITADTVEKHIERLYQKYDIRNAHGLMRLVVIGLCRAWEERTTNTDPMH